LNPNNGLQIPSSRPSIPTIRYGIRQRAAEPRPTALRSSYFLREDRPVLDGRAVKMDPESSPLQTPYPHGDQRLTQVDGVVVLSPQSPMQPLKPLIRRGRSSSSPFNNCTLAWTSSSYSVRDLKAQGLGRQKVLTSWQISVLDGVDPRSRPFPYYTNYNT
jgi:hypothetical protein